MKKILSMVLVSVMALGLGLGVFAASGVRYTEMDKALGHSYTGTGTLANSVLDLGDINADGIKIRFPLLSDMFKVKAGSTQPPAGMLLSAADIRASKIEVRTQIRGGSKVVQAVSIDTRNSSVEIEFVDEWVSTKEQDFEIFVYLTIDGKRQDADGITIIGTLANPEVEVYAEYDYVDLSSGTVADAQEFVNKIEVDLGNGVSIFTKFFKSKKYYGTATREVDEAADVVLKTYPDIDNVVTLKTVGLNSTGDIVKLDTDYANYYVYNKEMQYVGQANEMLPFSSVYYLANKKLNILDETEPEEEEPEEEELLSLIHI